MKRIFFYGPELAVKEASYGGGTGGVTRNVGNFMSFRSDDFTLVPLHHTVRLRGRGFRNLFPVRFLIDLWRFLRARFSHRAHGIHMLAQYRTATPREFAIVLSARMTGLPVLYHVKAGVFMTWYRQTSGLQRWMMRRIMAWSRIVLCEGKPYQPFVAETFGRDAHYFPNYVLDTEIPNERASVLTEPVLRVVFVGFCYEGKGVFELVRGCMVAAERGVPVQLSLVGHEDPPFTRWLDAQPIPPGLDLRRLGLKPHDAVLDLYRAHDIFCLPSRHPGEGHNNATNEAMMLGLCILVTRHGFLDSILDEASAIFLEGDLSESIANALERLHADRAFGRRLAENAHAKLIAEYTSGVLFPRLEQHYTELAR